MNSKDYRDLQEAYREVYALDEGVPEAIVSAANWVRKGPQRHQQAMAEREKRKMQKKIPYAALTAEEFDIVLSYLLDEGYVDSVEAAQGIVEVMSDEWLDEILDEGVREVISSVKSKIPKPKKRQLTDHSPYDAQQHARDRALMKVFAKK